MIFADLDSFYIFKIVVVAILIYVIIYALLKKIKIFGESDAVNGLIGLTTAVIVTFSGVVTYAVIYAVNWFLIIFFIIFLIIALLLFLGVKFEDIAALVSDYKKAVFAIFFILFIVIFFKSFFALNNTFDTSEPPESEYDIDTSANIGYDDVIEGEDFQPEKTLLKSILTSDLFASFMFLLILGILVMIVARSGSSS
jgi:hypothetical protein